PLAGALQVVCAQVVSAPAGSGSGISSGVPNLQPVLVQSKTAPDEVVPARVVGPSVHGPVLGQLSVNRLVEPSGVGPSGTALLPPPMLRPPQGRVFKTVAVASVTEPHSPPAARSVKSRCGTSSAKTSRLNASIFASRASSS